MLEIFFTFVEYSLPTPHPTLIAITSELSRGPETTKPIQEKKKG
jgi:hypothetical protein